MNNKKTGYNGNPSLKKAGLRRGWTYEQIMEWQRCSEDIVYFVEKYMKIVHVEDGKVSFKLYPYQKKMLKSFKENRFNIVTTARQAGKSTTTCAFILWYILFNDNARVGLLANKETTAQEILSRIQYAYELLPDWIQQGVKEWNKQSFYLENDSFVISAATSASSIRGLSLNLVFIDEAAFIDNWDEFYTSTFPVITSGKNTKMILVSTPNGMNHFYEIWAGANAKPKPTNTWKPIEVKWDQVPGRDEQWKEEVLSGLNWNYEKFKQENECEFLGSSGTLISGAGLKLIEENIRNTRPLYVHNDLYVYAMPERYHRYVTIVDVSRGKGLDYSTFSVIDVTSMPWQQVCVFRSNLIQTYDFADVLYQVLKRYNNSYVLVEINDNGSQVPDLLHHNYEYDNIISTAGTGKNGKRVSFGWDRNFDRGLRTTKVSKSIGCSMLKAIIEQGKLIINDKETYNELTTFSMKSTGTYAAEEGRHDDLVMPLVIFGWLTDDPFFEDYTNSKTLDALRDRTTEDIDNSLSFFVLTGDEIIEPEEKFNNSFDRFLFNSV